MKFICQRLAGVLAFHGEYRFKSFLLRSQDLHLFFMNIEIFCQLPNGLIEVSKFSFEMSSVVLSNSTLCVHSHNWESSLLESIALLEGN